MKEVPTIQLQRVAVFDLGWQSMLLISLVIFVLSRTEKAVYLVDFSCFEPPEDWRLSPKQIIDCIKFQGCFTQESIEFQEKMIERSGCGPKTAYPPAITKCLRGEKMTSGTEEAREESRVRENKRTASSRYTC